MTIDETSDLQDDDTIDTAVAALFSSVTDTSGDMLEYAQSSGAVVTSAGSGYGADQENGSTVFSLEVNGDGSTNLTTTDGDAISIAMEDGLLVGRDEGGDAVFAVSIDAQSGMLSVVQYESITNPTSPNEYDENVSLSYMDDQENIVDYVNAVVTVTDGDGDVATESIGIGGQISFSDDGPIADAALGSGSVSHDETVGLDSDAGDTMNAAVIALFSGVTNVSTDMAAGYALGTGSVINSSLSSYGQDEEGANISTVYSLDVLTTGVDSGLNTTDGYNILLYKEGDLVVGRIEGGAENGKAAFAISIDANGVLSIAQYASIWHQTGGTGSYDESISITNGSLLATVTLTDGDGDINSDAVAINGSVSFQDDAPMINSVMDAVLSSSTHIAFNGLYSANFGADGLDYMSVALGSGGSYDGQSVSFVQGTPDNGVTKVDVKDGSNNVLFSFYYTTTTDTVSGSGDGNVVFNAFINPLSSGTSEFFTLTVNGDGTYSFDLISNTALSTTTTSGEEFGAAGPTGSKTALMDHSLLLVMRMVH